MQCRISNDGGVTVDDDNVMTAHLPATRHHTQHIQVADCEGNRGLPRVEKLGEALRIYSYSR